MGHTDGIFSAIVLGIYLIFNDPTEVYGYSVINEYTAISMFVICTFLNGVPYVLAINRMPARPVPCKFCKGFHSTNDLLHGMSVFFAYLYVIRPYTQTLTDPRLSVRFDAEQGISTSSLFRFMLKHGPLTSHATTSLTRRNKEHDAFGKTNDQVPGCV